jgi:hypothetical protein
VTISLGHERRQAQDKCGTVSVRFGSLAGGSVARSKRGRKLDSSALDERLLEFVLGERKDLLPGGVYAWLIGQGELQCLGERP